MQSISQNTKKLLLAGNINAGKSSIHCIILGEFPKRVNFETYTSLDFDQFDTKFLSDLSVRIWELNMYTKTYGEILMPYLSRYQTIEKQREAFLEDTSSVVYVINAHSNDLKNEFNSLERGLECLKKYAPDSKVFILIHQCDRLEAGKREEIIEKCKEEIGKVEMSLEFPFEKIFQTSIWDDTLYRAWCEISQGLTQNKEAIRETLKYLTDTCSYDEVALFDMRTFLILDCYEKEVKDEVEKYERLGTVIKHFKTNCKKGIDMKSLLVSNSKFTAYISVFTPDTYIMAITFDTKTQPSVIELNVKEAKKFYGRRIGTSEPAEFMNEYIL